MRGPDTLLPSQPVVNATEGSDDQTHLSQTIGSELTSIIYTTEKIIHIIYIRDSK